MKSNQYLATLKTYAAIAKKWDSLHPTNEHHDDSFQYFSELLPSGRVLEVGCGSGNDSQTLVAHGYNYTGTDAVKEFVDIAKAKYPDRKFLQCAVQDVADMFSQSSFDGFWCSAVLLHIPRSEILETLKNLKKVTAPKSAGMISIQKGSGEKYEEGNKKTDGLPRLFVYYTQREFEELLDKAGFKTVHFIEKERADRPNWMHFVVKAK
ncbi:class I SAM-dependent methyltransferase [Candidatus Saccharibacteria bacterium]|nr:class I SAM-dependent methyltransferase [Candidatus Saccharibacteria bacterium]